MTSRDDATDIITRLDGAGLRVYDDPTAAYANRPCVLVGPPRADYTDKSRTWRLVVLSGKPTWSLATWTELEAIAETVCGVLPVETADPGSYSLSAEGPQTPAMYLSLVTTI